MTILRYRRGLPALLCFLAFGGALSGCSQKAATNPFDRVDATIPYDAGPIDSGVLVRPDSSIFNPFDDAGTPDTGVADAGIDAATGDGGTGDGGTGGISPTGLNDLVPCNTSVDCPAALGGAIDCITTVPLSHPDANGRTSIPVVEIFPGLNLNGAPKVGVCTTTCTFAEDACAAVTLAGAGGTPVPFTCRMVAVGAAPYPEPTPTFPFALDTAKMIQGTAFGALCLPPTEVEPASNPGICGSCDATTGCASGTCWDFLTNAPVTGVTTGTCLPACDANTRCPLGYTCDPLTGPGGPLGDFCRPITETCTSCRDIDADGRGVGRCTNTTTLHVSQVDCDDRNAVAYYESTDMLHPFTSGYCGDTDYNCNGQNDQAEIVARPDLYGVMHCGACSAGCTGAVPAGTPNAQKVCVPTAAGVMPPSGVCTADCDDKRNTGDCDADPENGCEYTAMTGAIFLYGDGDGDGAGDPTKQQVSCPASPTLSCDNAPCVSNQADCNDGNANIFGTYGAVATPLDRCNGNVDDDCDTVLEEDALGEACSVAGALPNCEPGTVTACSVGVPTCTTTFTTGPEVCNNGLDDNCNGAYDDGFVPGGAEVSCNGIDDNCDGNVDDHGPTNILLGSPCSVTDDTYAANDSAVGACRTGTWSCGGSSATAWYCRPSVAVGEARGFDGVDSNCDGHDLNTNNTPMDGAFAVFVRGNAAANMGTFAQPAVSLSIAMSTLAVLPAGWNTAGGKPDGVDVYVTTNPVAESLEVVLKPGVSIYGGLDTTFHTPGNTSGTYTCGSHSSFTRSSTLASLIMANQLNNVAMSATNILLPAPATLYCIDVAATVTAASPTPPNSVGRSNYAFKCVNCPGVTFHQVTLNAGDGTTGAAGNNGAASTMPGPGGVAPGAASLNAVGPSTTDWCPNTATANNTGGNGGGGQTGTTTYAGGSDGYDGAGVQQSPNGYCRTTWWRNSNPATAGGGTNGGAIYGANGSGGAGGTRGVRGTYSYNSTGGAVNIVWPPASGATGGDGAMGGGGGGASGSFPANCRAINPGPGGSASNNTAGSCCYWDNVGGGCPTTFPGGAGAGGGCLGNGGTYGQAGGSSVALYIDNSAAGNPLPNVVFENSITTLVLVRGSGGQGGAGGSGGNGSGGGSTMGTNWGGAGGGGGGGGGGAGGPGGHSYCIAYAVSSGAPIITSPNCNTSPAVAAGGTGGMGGTGGNGGQNGAMVMAGAGVQPAQADNGFAGISCRTTQPGCP